MPLHLDHNHARQTEFSGPPVDSAFTPAPVTGRSVTEVSQNVFANLGWDELKLPAPVFEGIKKTTVIEFERTVMVYEMDRAPKVLRPGAGGPG